jgi:hypothetical protein
MIAVIVRPTAEAGNAVQHRGSSLRGLGMQGDAIREQGVVGEKRRDESIHETQLAILP